MAFRIPRLPSKVAIVSKDGWPVQKFQQWWQSVAVAIERSINNIADVLVRLGLVEITADGALELSESAINADGTIKTNKVVTDSIIPNGVTVGDLITPPDVFCPANVATQFIETPFMTIGDGIVPGEGLVWLEFTVSALGNHDCSVMLSYYVDTGGGWYLARERPMGVTTDNGDSWWVLPGGFRYGVTGTQVRVRATCWPGVHMPSAQASDVWTQDISYAVFGGKR